MRSVPRAAGRRSGRTGGSRRTRWCIWSWCCSPGHGAVEVDDEVVPARLTERCRRRAAGTTRGTFRPRAGSPRAASGWDTSRWRSCSPRWGCRSLIRWLKERSWGWRLMAIHGFEWDAPDTKENAAAFGLARAAPRVSYPIPQSSSTASSPHIHDGDLAYRL